MHLKTLPAFLLLAPAVLANPVATDAANSDYSGDLDYFQSALDNIPSSILTVLETAVPVSWYMGLMDPASQSSFLSEASAGVYPDWYSALPSSVIAWASSAAENGDDFLFGGATATATATDSASESDSATGSASATASGSKSGSESATVTPTAKTSDTRDSTITGTVSPTDTKATTASSEAKASGTTSNATADASSSAASTSASSETSTGGAPLATGSVAMSLAGAAGLLGLVAVL
ncbi:uncharacterized protein N7469_002913 [Penicillium citrinum]|uniref:GPI anchored protein n=1 Tax=Penicillium citrinum TaxID=5077 RepID=A0A9W9PBG6_PENCI|nr:uncharacterized protein N7469_002913 [Penicillium citrinum]KAJ5241322.1 hypothetical protein N7469_002913 [Penicillium citrinum]